MKREGEHMVVIVGSSGIGLATARLAHHEGAEVTIAGRSQDKLMQARQELGKVHTVVMDITDEGAVKNVFTGLRHVDHGLISAGTMLNGAIVNNGGSCPLLVPIVSSPSEAYISAEIVCSRAWRRW